MNYEKVIKFSFAVGDASSVSCSINYIKSLSRRKCQVSEVLNILQKQGLLGKKGPKSSTISSLSLSKLVDIAEKIDYVVNKMGTATIYTNSCFLNHFTVFSSPSSSCNLVCQPSSFFAFAVSKYIFLISPFFPGA